MMPRSLLAARGRALQRPLVRLMSGSGSHPDFEPTRKVAQDGDAKSRIKEMLQELNEPLTLQPLSTRSHRRCHTKSSKETPVFLFMKGNPSQPQCGFSNQVVRILHFEGVKFNAFNVLADAGVREGIKDYSDWPTIPQLYINEEFVGGCDIVTDMHKSGELSEMLTESGAKVPEA